MDQSNFEDKRKLLFDCLETAEECIKGTTLEQKDQVSIQPNKTNQSKTVSRRFHGKESIFKRPHAPIQKCLRPRRVPDYQVNPHKWKKYSLGDTDISDKTNASAAFAFLNEIEKRKDAEQDNHIDDDVMDTNDEKVTFKRKSNSTEIRNPSFRRSISLRKEIQQDDENDEKAKFKGSKVLMPEYVIGQKKVKKLSTSTTTKDRNTGDKTKGPQLKHLFDYNDDE